MAKYLVRDVKTPIWIHGAAIDLKAAIGQVAEAHDLSVFQTTSDMNGKNFIHPYISAREQQLLFPRDVETFTNLVSSGEQSSSMPLPAPLARLAIVKSVADVSLGLSQHVGRLNLIIYISNIPPVSTKNVGSVAVID